MPISGHDYRPRTQTVLETAWKAKQAMKEEEVPAARVMGEDE